MPPNSTGVIPDYLTNETAQLGAAVAASFAPATALARLENATVACGAGAAPLILPLPQGGIDFDAVVLEEDLAAGGQRVAAYALQLCAAPDGACSDEAAWTTITNSNQTVTLGATIGRRVIERGFFGGNGVSVHATGLRLQCAAAFPAGTAAALIRTFSAHKMAPPRGWPKPPFSCSIFGCTCTGMADYYGVGASGGSAWGCAPAAAQEWWIRDAKPCAQPGYSCCPASAYTKRHAPFPGCS